MARVVNESFPREFAGLNCLVVWDGVQYVLLMDVFCSSSSINKSLSHAFTPLPRIFQAPTFYIPAPTIYRN